MSNYIKREDALSRLRQIEQEYRSRYNGAVAAAVAEYCHDALIDIPTADVVEKKQSRWVWDGNGMDIGCGAWVCLACGSKPETWWETDCRYAPKRYAASRYCPNCGAKMDGGGQ